MKLEKVEIDGNKFIGDPKNEGEALKNEEGEPIPYEEETAKKLAEQFEDDNDNEDQDDSKDKSSDDNSDKDVDKDEDINIKDLSIDELKEKHPEVAEKIEEANKYKEKLEELEKERKKKEENKKKEEGKYEELLEEKEKELEELEGEKTKFKELLSKHKDTINTLLEEVEKNVPDKRKSLIPENFSNRQKLEYIIKNAEHLGADIKMNKGGDVPPSKDEPPLDEEGKLWKEFAKLREKDSLTHTEKKRKNEIASKIKEIRRNKE